VIKTKAKKVAIVDVDGTLVFNDEARARANLEVVGIKQIPEHQYKKLSRAEKDKLYNLTACKYKEYLRPNQELVDRLNNQNDKYIIVLTGRHSNVEVDTIETLEKIGLRYDKLYTNPDPKATHTEFKSAKLNELINGFESIEIYEDDEGNIRALKQQADERFSFFFVSPNGVLRI
jgi:FMN phosphatase YigB (HAD superfamily)